HGLVVGIEQPVQLRTARLHALGELGFGQALLLHERVELAGDHTLDGARRHLFVNAVILEKIIEGGADASLLPAHVTSFLRLIARSKSVRGVFCVFLMKACSRIIRSRWTQNRTRPIRPCVKSLLTSHSPLPSARHSGMPIGQENSTSLMSSPMILRSILSRPLSHSRTGSRPDGSA